MEKKERILVDIFGNFRRSKNERLFFCPKCLERIGTAHHKNKLSINLEKNAFKCWVCGYFGNNIYRLIREFGNYNHVYEWRILDNIVDLNEFESLFEKKEEKEQVTDLPESYISLSNKNLPFSSNYALEYLSGRSISQEIIDQWRIGFCPLGKYKNRIIIPSFNDTGDVNYFVARSYSRYGRDYLNPPASKNIIFNSLFINWDKDVILVEGAFDAIVAGENSIPILGNTLNENSKLFQKIVKEDSRIFLALDLDAKNQNIKIASKLLKYDIEIYEINVHPYKDVGKMTSEDFLKKKEDSTRITFDNFLKRKVQFI
jgi:DNA primase